MPDVDDVTNVLDRLANPEFARLLKAKTPDGRTPVIPARLEEPFHELISKIRRAGGAANLVIPVIRGAAVLSITLVEDVLVQHAHAVADGTFLDDAATAGVILARVTHDGGAGRYGVPLREGDNTEAEVSGDLVC